jgi:hypothetical protein
MTAASASNSALAHILIYAGALPFVAGALLLVAGIHTLPLLGGVAGGVAAYGLIIVVFLTGIHWGQQLSLGRAASGLFVSSNILAVAIWVAWLVLPEKHFMVFLAIPLVVMLVIDRKLCRAGVLEKEYLFSRGVITAVVIATLFVSASFT